jgi:diguanylate cyclase (GGDEF)-like protein
MGKKTKVKGSNDRFYLRRQILLLFFSVIIVFILLVDIFSNNVIMGEFNDIAEKSGRDNMRLVTNILNIEIKRLEASAKDYGGWDDTYNFVIDKNEEYIESNFVDETFENNDWNALFIVGNDRSIVYSKGYDSDTQEEVSVPGEFVHLLGSEGYLFDKDVEESAIIDTAKGPIIIVTYPILRSDGTGPGRGWFVCVRYLDSHLIDDIREQSLVDFVFEERVHWEENDDIENLRLGNHDIAHIWIHKEEDCFKSISNVYDYGGNVIFALTHDIDMALIKSGKDIAFKYSASTVIILMTTSVLILLFVNRKVFERLKKLIDSITNILENNDLSKRVAVSHNDEISILENRFNTLLETIEESQFEILHQAHHDSLTGTLNRGAFFYRVEEKISRYKNNGKKFAIIFIDLDGFKEINDSLGHQMGDYILKGLSKRLRKVVKGYGGFTARFGGDEFVIFIPDVSAEAQLVQFLEAMLDSIKQPMEINNKICKVTCSAGVSLFPEHGETVDDLINNADIAMYSIKKHNKNNFAFYSEDMRNKISLEMMQKALDNEEFILYYQKQVDASTGKTQGVETLIRWMHPEYGMIPPVDFIALAEETGFIVPLGRWILDEACKQCKAWNEGVNSKLKVAVNISSVQFMQRDFIKEVTKIIELSGINPRNLEFEITESVALYKEEEVINKIKQLKQLGIRIAIDDFGTGYSSLNYLEKFNIDGLKIDKAFVDHINKNSSVAKSIIALAESLGLSVVAEGVETESQVSCLLELGCRCMQGYYFAKPAPPEELI